MPNLVKNEGVIARLSAAYKALTGVPTQRAMSYRYDYPSINGQFPNSNLDYASLAGDLSQSSLIMSGVRWLGNVLPVAPLMVREDVPGKDGAKGETREVPNHELVRLWRRPNRYYSGSTLLKGFAYSWILSGNAYFLKVRNQAGTKVVELWNEPYWSIRPRWVGDNLGIFIEGEEDDPSAFISYYELDRAGRKYRVEVDDVVHFRDGFDPRNDRLGLSRLGAILREVYGDSEAANYAARMAGGSGVPPFVLSIDKELSLEEEDVKGIESALVRKTTGDMKGTPLVVTGATVEKMGVNPDEMDLRSSHRFSEERFSAVTGIPAVALELGAGHEHSIYNNVKAADERAWEAYLLPLYGHIEDELDVQLLPSIEGRDSRRYCRFDLSGVRALQEDEDAKSKRIVGEYQGGIITLNEARSMRNMEPVNGGDTFHDAQSVPTGQEEETRLRLVKSAPPPDVIKEAVEWWEQSAPDEAKDLIDADTVG